MNLQKSLLALAAGASLVDAAQAAAQPEAAAADQGPSGDRLEQIVVTARRREESLQSVPAAVTALTGPQLRELQVNDTTDLQNTVSNITTVDENAIVAGTLTAFIRGIGTDPGFQQGVGIYVDDLYLQSPLATDIAVYSNIERIEVLKGPQGNLYGRNTIGGAIKYVTRDPGDDVHVSAEVRGGRFDLRQVTADVSGPLVTGQLAGDVGVLWKQRDGFEQNVTTGQKLGSVDQRAVHAELKWTPSDSVRIKLGGAYSLDTSNPRGPTFLGPIMTQTPFGAVPQPTLIYGLLSATLPLPQLAPLEPFIRPIAAANAPGLNTPPVYPVLGPDQTATNMDYTQFVTESSTGFLTAQWDVAAQVSLKSMTTYRTVRVHNNLDLDGTAQDYINTFQHIRNSDFSQELQLNATSDKAALVAGVYYLHGIDGEPSDDTISPRTQLTTITTEQQLRSDQIVKSYAVYGNLDYNLTQALRLSLGARFTHEDVGIDLQDVQTNTTLPQLAIAGTAYAFPLLNSPLAIGTAQAIAFGSGGALKFVAPTSVTNVTNVSPSAAFKRFTPSAKLAYDLNPHTMGYVGYAEGYKAGGFDTFRPFTQFNPEKVKSYTVGLKTTTPDSRLRFNTELFYNDYTDKQLSTVFLIDNSLGKVTKNAGQVHTYGVDMDLAWVTPLKGLRAGLTAGYLKTKVQHYFDIDANTGQLIDRAPNTRLGFSPEWTGAVNLSYTMPLAAVGELTFAGNVAYRSMSYTDSPIDLTSTAASLEVQRAHATENAGITYRTSDERWHVALEGRNLSDKRVITNSFNAGVGTVIGQYNDPRTWSLSVGYNFK